MLFARLNPSHRDTVEMIKKRLPASCSISAPKLEELASAMPYTDQKTFFQYLSTLAPKFSVAIELGYDKGVDVVYADAPHSAAPMDRGIDEPPRFLSAPRHSTSLPPPPPPPLSSGDAYSN